MINEYIKFLKSLKKNNHKEWMDANRAWYEKVRNNLIDDVNELIEGIYKIDSRFSKLSAKECMFRINRDIRFSKDKRPYKENLGMYFSLLGKKSSGPGYYLHIEPGNSFFACGCWMPPADVLYKIRQEIDYNANDFIQIISNKNFKKIFKEIEGEKLKNIPKGFDETSSVIEYLKLKSFVVTTSISDDEITNGAFKNKFLNLAKVSLNFHDFLLVAVTDEEVL
jgi:uncharacterized protein (TIGR02453 family)